MNPTPPEGTPEIIGYIERNNGIRGPGFAKWQEPVYATRQPAPEGATPETDAECTPPRAHILSPNQDRPMAVLVSSDFAHKLERERDEARAELAAERKRREDAEKQHIVDLKERAKLAIQLTDHIPAADQIGALQGKIHKLQASLDSALSDVGRLRDALQTVKQAMLHTVLARSNTMEMVEKALAAQPSTLVAELRAEVERLKGRNEIESGFAASFRERADASMQLATNLGKEIESLRAQLAEARKDGERLEKYAKLVETESAEMPGFSAGKWFIARLDPDGVYQYPFQSFRAAIDAAQEAK